MTGKLRARSGRTASLMSTMGALVLLAGCTGNKVDEPSGPPLTGAEITKLVVGNTVDGAVGAEPFSFYYKDGVSVSGVIGMSGNDDSGTWSIKGEDVYCNSWIVFFDGVERCYRWFETERGYLMVNVDAYHSRDIVVHGIKQGNPLGF